MNNVCLVGRLTRDPEVRTASNDSLVATFTLAVPRGNEADFINCSTFAKQAEVINRFTHKGSMIGVKGRLTSRVYEDKTGTKRTIIDVLVDNVTLLGTKEPAREPKEEFKGNSIKQEEIVLDDADLPF